MEPSAKEKIIKSSYMDELIIFSGNEFFRLELNFYQIFEFDLFHYL